MKKLLWLDDKRDPNSGEWLRFSPIEKPFEIIWIKKYYQFVDWITENGLPDGICFDHDLSDIHCYKSTYKEKTGMDCAKWLVEYCLNNNKELPKYNIQSTNICGKENINGLFQSFIKNI